jgi:Rhodopirellula transposase DDE domain
MRHPDRDAQFRYINEQVMTTRTPPTRCISVDAKKKELVGQFANGGQEWRPKGQPVAAHTHDSPRQRGQGRPLGVYDITGNTGWVRVGTDHDAAAFAVESIRRS